MWNGSHCSTLLLLILGCTKSQDQLEALAVDEPPHQICSYTLLFSLFLYFLYIIDPPLCTPTVLALAYLMDT